MNSFTLEKSKILVTGASGFIGSHLVKELSKLGAEVYGIRHENKVNNCIEVPCDLRNVKEVEAAVEFAKPEFVFHLASQSIVSIGDMLSYNTIETNVMGSVNLLHTLSSWNTRYKRNLHGVIVASTDKVYGRHKSLPYKEDFSLLGTEQIYETSKHCEDILSQSFAHTFGLPIAITRFGNVYGPGDYHWSRIVPGTIKSLVDGIRPTIRSNGQQYRDYVYITDVIDGYIALAFHMQKSVNNLHIFNFGTGIPCRALDIVGMISENFQGNLDPYILNEAKKEIEKQYVDSTHARDILGWKPKVKIKNGIEETVQWYKTYLKGVS